MLLTRQQFAAAMFASQDPTRYTIARLRINPDGGVEATNGHVLIRVKPYKDGTTPGLPSGQTDPVEPLFIRHETAKRLLVKPKIDGPFTLSLGADGEVRISASIAETIVTDDVKSEGQWPNTDPMFTPAPEGSLSVVLSATYLRMLGELSQEAGRRHSHDGIRLTIEPTGEQYPKPVRFRWKCLDGQIVEGLLMPMKTED